MSEPNHYKAFDGLRGFAAVSVVFFHIGHWLGVPWLATNSGLAVDLFFCLSGYVVVLAYGGRLKAGMTLAKFVRVRLVRLMPMILLGLFISVLYSVMSIFVKHEPVDQLALALAFLLAMVNLPYLHAPTSIGGPQVFPLNGPQYSLFLELAVNFVWALLRRVDGLVLSLILTVVSFAFMLLFPGIGDETATFWQGIPRVCTSFFLGVALFYIDARFLQGRAAGSRLWPWLFWISVAAMVVIFYTPVPLHALSQWLWVPLVSPLLVLCGAKVRLPAAISPAAVLAGALSYPVYALHYPLFRWVNGVYQTVTHQRSALIEGPIILVVVLLLSYLALKFIDEPVRKFMSQRFLSSRA